MKQSLADRILAKRQPPKDEYQESLLQPPALAEQTEVDELATLLEAQPEPQTLIERILAKRNAK